MDRPILLLTTVDIEDQSKDVIVREGDDPREVARAFCLENGLNENVMEALAEHLDEQIKQQEADLAAATADAPEATLPPPPAAPEPAKTASPEARSREPDFAYPAGPLGGERRSSLNRPAFVTDSTVMSEQPGVSQSVDANLPRKKKPANAHAARASTSRVSGGGVSSDPFERLYARAEQTRAKHERLRKEQEQKVNQMTQSFRMAQTRFRPRTAGNRVQADFTNPGDRLYAEGVLLKKQKQDELAKKKQEEEEERYREQCTFKPVISNLAQRLVAKNELAAWERLHEGAKRKQEMMRASVEKKAVEEEEEEEVLKECTFRPQIDTKSAKMMGDRTEALRGNAITVFDQLSQDALRRRMRQEEYANWYPEEATFQPRILEASRAMVDKRQSVFLGTDPSKVAAESAENSPGAHISDQLIQRGRVAEMKMNQIRASKDSNIDPTTGRRLFKPETGRPPAFGRELNGMSVNQFLYERGLDAMRKKQEMGKMLDEKKKREATGRFVNPSSQKMLEKLKKKRFRKIYEYLRQVLEQEGLVPPHPEDQAAIEVDFSPFLDEGTPLLEDLDAEVRRDVDVVLQIAAQEQLSQAGDGQVLMDESLFLHLMDQVVQGPRDYLQPGTSRKEVVEEFSFKPQINTDEESLRMVARRRPSHMKIYEILLAEKNTTEDKIQQLKHHIEQERLKECRFEPETNKTFVQSRFMRPATTGGVRGSAHHAEEAGGYDDLEREVRMILEKHSGTAGGAEGAAQELEDLIAGAGQGDTEAVMNRLARHLDVNDSPQPQGKHAAAGMPWDG